MFNTILRSTKFLSDPTGHGGNRRTLQIQELIEKAGLRICDVEEVKTGRLNEYFAGIRFLSKYPFQIRLCRHAVRISGREYLTYQNAFNQYTGDKIFLWEATASYIPPYIAQELGFRIIALPHNLESLVVQQRDPYTLKPSPEGLGNELKHLGKADAVFCISREEQWLLKLHGINADFLPYYPPKLILDRLLLTRKLRSGVEHQRFLIIGTALNPPTCEGMIEQIQWLQAIRKHTNFEVDIAGYGTEKLREFCPDSNFHIYGGVDQDKLDHLLTNAKAVLVHQKAGVGALTRIPELMIAGIPVIASSNACRSAFSYPGIYCYDDQDELEVLIAAQLETPRILTRPIEAEQRFIASLI